jgi:phosphatidylglycerophosphate synthase
MLSSKKTLVEPLLNPLVKPLARVNPNTLTLLGSIPPIVFFVFIVYHLYFWSLIALILTGVDMLDGVIARKYHKVTAFGGFLDSTIDRIADFFLITAFAFGGIVRWEIVAPFLLFAYLTSYVRSRGELANPKVSFALGIIERPERIILIGIALLLYMIFPTSNFIGFNIAESTFMFITLLSFYTLLQRIHHAYKKL